MRKDGNFEIKKKKKLKIKKNKRSPLSSSSSSGKIDIVRLLTSQEGIEIDILTNNKTTSFNYACSKGFLEIAKLLFSKGARINAKDKYG